MKLTTPILVVEGYLENLGDWMLAANLLSSGFTDVLEKECIQNFPSPEAERVQAADFRRIILAYSFGGASTKFRFDPIWEHPPTLFRQSYMCDLWCGIAIVPDTAPPCLQDHGVWHKPRLCKQAVCFQITHAWPISEPLKDANAVWFDLDDPMLLDKIIDRDVNGEPVYPSININCDKLVAGLDPLKQHITIMNHPQLLAFIRTMLLVYPEGS